MPRFYYYIGILAVLLMTNCSTIKVNNERQNTTTQNLQLGTIGEQKQFILETDYNHLAYPKYKKPIKVSINEIVFNKLSYKAYNDAKSFQNKNNTIVYSDSIADKPKFLSIELADRVTILRTLKTNSNKDVFKFISNKKEAHLVTNISIVLNAMDHKTLINADEVFLQQTGIKNYALIVYKDNVIQNTINFNTGVVFAYQSSNFCWKQNNKYQVEIVDIVECNDKCPKGSYTSAKRANKKINYYKL